MLGPTARRGSHHKQESTPAPPVVTVASILTNPALLPLADITALRLVGKDRETFHPCIMHSLLDAIAASEAEGLRHCAWPAAAGSECGHRGGRWEPEGVHGTTLPVNAKLSEA